MLDKITTVIYAGDDIDRKKAHSSLKLMDQTILSIKSVREAWSKNVKIKFIHTKPLNQRTQKFLEMFDVGITKWDEDLPTGKDHLNGNKLLVAKIDIDTPYFLLLDGDTVIHRPLVIDNYDQYDLLLSYAGHAFESKHWKKIFEAFELEYPKSTIYKEPMCEYVFNDKDDIFPWFNTGVIFGKTQTLKEFYDPWRNNMRICRSIHKYPKFKGVPGGVSKRAEPVSFVGTLFQLNIDFGILPKGYNINPKFSRLIKEWEDIYITHYAGNKCNFPESIADFLNASGTVNYEKFEIVRESW